MTTKTAVLVSCNILNTMTSTDKCESDLTGSVYQLRKHYTDDEIEERFSVGEPVYWLDGFLIGAMEVNEKLGISIHDMGIPDCIEFSPEQVSILNSDR